MTIPENTCGMATNSQLRRGKKSRKCYSSVHIKNQNMHVAEQFELIAQGTGTKLSFHHAL